LLASALTPFPHRWGLAWLLPSGFGSGGLVALAIVGLILENPLLVWASSAALPLCAVHAVSLRDIPRKLDTTPSGLRARTFTGRSVVIDWSDLSAATFLDGSGPWQQVRQLRLRAGDQNLLLVSAVPGFEEVRREASRRIGLSEQREFNGWRHHLRWWWLPVWDQAWRFRRFEEEGSGHLAAAGEPGEFRGSGEWSNRSDPANPDMVEWKEPRWKKGVLMAAVACIAWVAVPLAVLDGSLSTVFILLAAVLPVGTILAAVIMFRECAASIKVSSEGLEAVTYAGRLIRIGWESVESVERWPRGGRRFVSRNGRTFYLPGHMDGDAESHSAVVAAIDASTPATVRVAEPGLLRYFRW
jgi:hypothetical protein